MVPRHRGRSRAWLRERLTYITEFDETAMHAVPLNSPLFFPPPPVGMKSPPVRVALLVFSDQNSEAHAGASITLFAKLMEANHFRLSIALRVTRSGRCCHRTEDCDRNSYSRQK